MRKCLVPKNNSEIWAIFQQTFQLRGGLYIIECGLRKFQDQSINGIKKYQIKIIFKN